MYENHDLSYALFEYYTFSFKHVCIDFFKRERKGEREVETSMEKKHQWLPSACPKRGVEPTTEACAQSGNWTGDLLVRGLMLNHLATLFGLEYDLLTENN